MSMNVFSEPISFKLDDVPSWGVKKDKYKNYSLSIKPDDDTVERVKALVTEHNTKDPLYGESMYLKIASLSDKQRKELLDCGRCRVKVMFDVTGVYTSRDGVGHIVFNVKGLGKIEGDEVKPPMDL